MSTIKSYQDAKNYLGNKSDRPFANNTRIKLDEHNLIFATYHNHPIVQFYPDRMSLNTCGWYTSTTKERLNWFIPKGFSIYQEQGTWYLVRHSTHPRGAGRYVFQDGITIDNHGQVFNAAPDSRESEIKATTKAINKYIKEYADALVSGEIDPPSNGDCWYCLMQTDSGQSLGEVSHNIDHLESHFEESYFVPSLLIRAVKLTPMCPIANGCMYKLWESKESLSKWEQDILTRDVKASLSKYLKSQFNIAR